MSAKTCLSLIKFKVFEERLIEPFQTQRIEKANAMFNEGKAEMFPNSGDEATQHGNVTVRFWVDRAAAQEFIDYVTPLAESYGIEIYTGFAETGEDRPGLPNS